MLSVNIPPSARVVSADENKRTDPRIEWAAAIDSFYRLFKHFAFTRSEPRTYRTRALPRITSARWLDTG